MIEISLTTFVDFVITAGTPKLTCVRKAKQMYGQDYQPEFDYWRQLRRRIEDMHKGGLSKSSLDSLISGMGNPGKRHSYERGVLAYQRWMGRKSFEWIGRNSQDWIYGDLKVRVNPELGLRIDGDDRVIKLYFKNEHPSKRRLETILFLMQETLPNSQHDRVAAVLDVSRGKLIPANIRSTNQLQPLLKGEAAAFLTMWDSV